jgi:hypothetical protein
MGTRADFCFELNASVSQQSNQMLASDEKQAYSRDRRRGGSTSHFGNAALAPQRGLPRHHRRVRPPDDHRVREPRSATNHTG